MHEFLSCFGGPCYVIETKRGCIWKGPLPAAHRFKGAVSFQREPEVVSEWMEAQPQKADSEFTRTVIVRVHGEPIKHRQEGSSVSSSPAWHPPVTRNQLECSRSATRLESMNECMWVLKFSG